VCHFYKYFYSLKQATRALFRRLSQQLLKPGFEESKVDYSLFILCTNTFRFFVLTFHLHDLLDITKMIGVKHLACPMTSGMKLSSNKGTIMWDPIYRIHF